MVLRLLIPASLLLFFAGCTCGSPPEPAVELAARVNGAPVRLDVFETEVARNLERHRKQGHAVTPGVEYGVRMTVLERMIDDEIVETKLAALDVDPEGHQLKARFAKYRGGFANELDFQAYLERTNNTVDMIEASLRRDILVESLAGTFEPSAAKMRAYYEANQSSYRQGAEVRPFLEVKGQIAQLLGSRARDAKTRELLQQLKAAAEVERLITITPPGPDADAKAPAPEPAATPSP